MTPRKYNKAILVNRATAVDDGYGGFTTTEALLFSCWANVETKGSKRGLESGITANLLQTVFTIRNRYDFDVNPKTDSIYYAGLTYNIESVTNNDLNNIDVEIRCIQRD